VMPGIGWYYLRISSLPLTPYCWSNSEEKKMEGWRRREARKGAGGRMRLAEGMKAREIGREGNQGTNAKERADD